MKFWMFLFGAALAVAPTPLRAQTSGAITIVGEMPGAADSALVAIFEPMPGLPLNYFFAAGPNEAVVRGGKFTYQLRHGQTGFVRFQGNDAPQQLAFVEPGARVEFAIAPAKGAEAPQATFSGTNAAANNLLANRQLLNGGPPDGARVAKTLAAAPTAAGVLLALQAEMKKPNALLLAAYQQRQISKLCYDVLTAETEQRILLWAGDALMRHFSDSAKANLNLKMSRSETRKLVNSLFSRYNPALPRYRCSAMGNLGTEASFREKGVLPGPRPASRPWLRHEALFAPVADHVGRYDYLPAASQSQVVGDLLLTASALNAMSAADFAKVSADYLRLFPASPYNPVIKQVLQTQAAKAQLTKSAPATVGQNITLGRFDTGARALAFAPAPGLDTVKTLAGLVRQQFRGRPVFIDFWASWCGPCIAEFRHEPALHDFLSQNGIEVLYVSVDQPGYREKWAALAAKYNLRGYHYLASPAVQESLKPVISYIPRYMLFDKTGALVEASTYHPSEGDKLYQQLRERLQGK
ncbi:TlpA family protein disulfide reductase [Hymenobacter arizonensis]|uniref:Redoxin n=1 Tax=Hymenobacter arizonensis TaxID=1227077 RepID=A0A1I5XX60_HYMAR|nr:TlpA disulfide reductase family protein [Hymenobacter arizonensis]SFQ36496.1 Redoxin [Hymenobacter arizonensis]